MIFAFQFMDQVNQLRAECRISSGIARGMIVQLRKRFVDPLSVVAGHLVQEEGFFLLMANLLIAPG